MVPMTAELGKLMSTVDGNVFSGADTLVNVKNHELASRPPWLCQAQV